MKGQVIILGIMLFLVSFIVAVITAPVLKDLITDARAADVVDPVTGDVTTEGMDCGATGLSTGASATCVAIDIALPMFIGTVIFAGLSLITNQFVGG